MTSKIVVNNIEADSGINTVTFNSNIQGNLIGDVTGNVNSTGVTTVTSLRIGTGTSISSPATNVLTLGTNNVERVRINSSGNLGIGTNNPQARLSVGAGSLVDANVPIQISSQSATGLAYYGANNNGSYGALFGYDRTGFSGGVIRVIGSTDNISFVVNNTTVAGTFDSSGNLGIGITNPVAKLQVNVADSANILVSSSNDSHTGGLAFGDTSSNTSGRISYDHFTNALRFDTVSTERARFNSSGAFVFAGGTTNANGIGIAFPATQSASSDPNTLDDYEEGTWTPTYHFAGGGSVSYQDRVGVYTKIGRVVYISGRIAVSTISSPSGQVFVRGLPFIPATYSQRINGITIHRAGSWNTAPIAGTVFETNSGEIELYKASSTANNTTDLLGSDLGGNCFILFFGKYEV